MPGLIRTYVGSKKTDAQLARLAKAAGTSRSEIIRQLVEWADDEVNFLQALRAEQIGGRDQRLAYLKPLADDVRRQLTPSKK